MRPLEIRAEMFAPADSTSSIILAQHKRFEFCKRNEYNRRVAYATAEYCVKYMWPWINGRPLLSIFGSFSVNRNFSPIQFLPTQQPFTIVQKPCLLGVMSPYSASQRRWAEVNWFVAKNIYLWQSVLICAKPPEVMAILVMGTALQILLVVVFGITVSLLLFHRM